MAQKRIGKIVGVVVLVGLAIAAWLVFRPGPMAFADGKRVELAAYTAGKPTGVPADLNAEFRQLRAWFDECAARPDEWHAGKLRELHACIQRVFNDSARSPGFGSVSVRQPQSV